MKLLLLKSLGVRIVAADAPVLKHQGISSNNADS